MELAIQTQSSNITTLNLVMSLAGWEVQYADIDLTGAKPTAEIKLQRSDGRWLWARVDAVGRCTTETFQRERNLMMDPKTKGRRPLTPLVNDVFLGRKRHEGPRSMLRSMTNYITDNATQPVALSSVRSAWAALMNEPSRISDSQESKNMKPFNEWPDV